MNRREALTYLAAAASIPVSAQSGSTAITTIEPNAVQRVPSKEERDLQYKVCRERGHTPTNFGNMHETLLVNAVFTIVSDTPFDEYRAETSTDWQTCWFCKKQYRYVTKIEEKG